MPTKRRAVKFPCVTPHVLSQTLERDGANVLQNVSASLPNAQCAARIISATLLFNEPAAALDASSKIGSRALRMPSPSKSNGPQNPNKARGKA